MTTDILLCSLVVFCAVLILKRRGANRTLEENLARVERKMQTLLVCIGLLCCVFFVLVMYNQLSGVVQ